jgi:hypothetical protein
MAIYVTGKSGQTEPPPIIRPEVKVSVLKTQAIFAFIACTVVVRI